MPVTGIAKIGARRAVGNPAKLKKNEPAKE